VNSNIASSDTAEGYHVCNTTSDTGTHVSDHCGLVYAK